MFPPFQHKLILSLSLATLDFRLFIYIYSVSLGTFDWFTVLGSIHEGGSGDFPLPSSNFARPDSNVRTFPAKLEADRLQ